MVAINKLWLATLTKNKDDAETDTSRLNLTVNIDGRDAVDRDFGFLAGSGWLSGGFGPDKGWLGRGATAISEQKETLEAPFDTTALTNSSIRLGIRSDDAWAPHHAILLGSAQRQVIALAMETEIDHWLSTDTTEGKLSIPMRLVGQGDSNTQIRRILVLAYTESGDDAGTEHPVQIQITAGGNLVLQHSAQGGFGEYTGNLYMVDAAAPFTKSQMQQNGGIRVSVLGKDAWIPKSLFVYGLDTATGRPNNVVHLASVPEWTFGALSADVSEGKPSVALPVG